MRPRISSRSARNAGSTLQLALELVGQQRERRPDVAEDLGVREEHFLHVGRRVADMNHLQAVGAHQERRLLDRVMADRDDQIGMIHRPVHVVARRKRGGAHVVLGAAGDGTLAHLRVEERDAGALHEARQLRRRGADDCRPPPIMISGRFAFWIIFAARLIASGCATGHSTGCGGTTGTSPTS